MMSIQNQLEVIRVMYWSYFQTLKTFRRVSFTRGCDYTRDITSTVKNKINTTFHCLLTSIPEEARSELLRGEGREWDGR